MDITKLQYICTVAEELNITKAAQKLFLAQPYLSSLVTNTEKKLNIKIFDRSVSPLQLTYEGEVFIKNAREIIALQNQLEKELQDVRELRTGKLSIGCPFSLGTYILPLTLPKFHDLYPNIELELHELLPKEIEQLLSKGLLDVGFTSTSPEDTKLEHIPVLQQIYKVAVGPDHPFVERFPKRQLSVKELAHEQFVSNIPGTLFRTEIEHFFASANLQYNVLLNCKNSETAKALVSQGFGVMFIHESMINKMNNPHQLVYFSLIEKAPEFTISIITNPQAYISLATQKFIDLIRYELLEEKIYST